MYYIKGMQIMSESISSNPRTSTRDADLNRSVPLRSLLPPVKLSVAAKKPGAPAPTSRQPGPAPVSAAPVNAPPVRTDTEIVTAYLRDNTDIKSWADVPQNVRAAFLRLAEKGIPPGLNTGNLLELYVNSLFSGDAPIAYVLAELGDNPLAMRIYNAWYAIKNSDGPPSAAQIKELRDALNVAGGKDALEKLQKAEVVAQKRFADEQTVANFKLGSLGANPDWSDIPKEVQDAILRLYNASTGGINEEWGQTRPHVDIQSSTSLAAHLIRFFVEKFNLPELYLASLKENNLGKYLSVKYADVLKDKESVESLRSKFAEGSVSRKIFELLVKQADGTITTAEAARLRELIAGKPEDAANVGRQLWVREQEIVLAQYAGLSPEQLITKFPKLTAEQIAALRQAVIHGQGPGLKNAQTLLDMIDVRNYVNTDDLNLTSLNWNNVPENIRNAVARLAERGVDFADLGDEQAQLFQKFEASADYLSVRYADILTDPASVELLRSQFRADKDHVSMKILNLLVAQANGTITPADEAVLRELIAKNPDAAANVGWWLWSREQQIVLADYEGLSLDDLGDKLAKLTPEQIAALRQAVTLGLWAPGKENAQTLLDMIDVNNYVNDPDLDLTSLNWDDVPENIRNAVARLVATGWASKEFDVLGDEQTQLFEKFKASADYLSVRYADILKDPASVDLLRSQFNDADSKRIFDLLVKQARGEITDDERKELSDLRQQKPDAVANVGWWLWSREQQIVLADYEGLSLDDLGDKLAKLTPEQIAALRQAVTLGLWAPGKENAQTLLDMIDVNNYVNDPDLDLTSLNWDDVPENIRNAVARLVATGWASNDFAVLGDKQTQLFEKFKGSVRASMAQFEPYIDLLVDPDMLEEIKAQLGADDNISRRLLDLIVAFHNGTITGAEVAELGGILQDPGNSAVLTNLEDRIVLYGMDGLSETSLREWLVSIDALKQNELLNRLDRALRNSSINNAEGREEAQKAQAFLRPIVSGTADFDNDDLLALGEQFRNNVHNNDPDNVKLYRLTQILQKDPSQHSEEDKDFLNDANSNGLKAKLDWWIWQTQQWSFLSRYDGMSSAELARLAVIMSPDEVAALKVAMTMVGKPPGGEGERLFALVEDREKNKAIIKNSGVPNSWNDLSSDTQQAFLAYVKVASELNDHEKKLLKLLKDQRERDRDLVDGYVTDNSISILNVYDLTSDQYSALPQDVRDALERIGASLGHDVNESGVFESRCEIPMNNVTLALNDMRLMYTSENIKRQYDQLAIDCANLLAELGDLETMSETMSEQYEGTAADYAGFVHSQLAIIQEKVEELFKVGGILDSFNDRVETLRHLGISEIALGRIMNGQFLTAQTADTSVDNFIQRIQDKCSTIITNLTTVIGTYDDKYDSKTKKEEADNWLTIVYTVMLAVVGTAHFGSGSLKFGTAFMPKKKVTKVDKKDGDDYVRDADGKIVQEEKVTIEKDLLRADPGRC